MEARNKSRKQMTSSIRKDMWLQHVPIPKILEIATEELKRESYNDQQDFLEEILPCLCFSLPPNSQYLSQLMHTLPQSSSVWDKLMEGHLNKRYLPHDVLILLYQQRPSYLEMCVFSIFSQYAQISYIQENHNFSTFTTEYFATRGSPVEKAGENQNFWQKSQVVSCAETSKPVFNTCTRIFFKLAVDAQFSLPFLHGVSDFFACLFHGLGKEIFKHFPESIQFVVYLLTFPLDVTGAEFNAIAIPSHIQNVEDALLKLLQDGGVSVVRSLLCFFPYWLPVLSASKFMEKFLQFTCCL